MTTRELSRPPTIRLTDEVGRTRRPSSGDRENSRIVDRKSAARYIGVPVTMLDRMVADGHLPAPVAIYRRKLFDRRQLDAALDKFFDVEVDDEAAAANPWDEIHAPPSA